MRNERRPGLAAFVALSLAAIALACSDRLAEPEPSSPNPPLLP